MAGSTRTRLVQSEHVPSPIPVNIYAPDADGTTARPLLLLLHGGDGNAADLDRFVPVLDQAIVGGALPPIVVATPGVGRSLYMDHRDGGERWESFILADLLPALRGELNVSTERSGTFVGGWSMGGLGALRLAFKHPEAFAAVVAVEPAIEPAIAWREVGPLVKFWRPDALFEKVFGTPVDADYWAANNPATIASRDPARLLNLGIYLEVGDQDMLHLHDGVEFLHRILFDARIGHEYRLVRGADHVGPSLDPRMADALAFLGRQIAPPNWSDERVERLRATMGELQRAASVRTNIGVSRRARRH